MLTRALTTYEKLDDRFGIAEASGQLAIVHMENGDHEAAEPLYRTALDLSRTLGYRRGEAVNLANLGSSLYLQGSIADALDLYDEAAAVFYAIGDRRGAALIRANAASVRFTILGDDAVEADVETSLDYFQAEDHRWGAAFCHEHLAAIEHRRGRSAQAQSHIETGLALLAEGGHRWVEVHLRRLGARIALDAGQREAAHAHVKAARAICAELGLKHVAPAVESLAGMVALAAGSPGTALDLAREATDMLEEGSEETHVVWYRRYLAAEAAGAHDDAREALAEAARILNELTDRLTPEIARSARTQVPDHRAIIAASQRTFSTKRTVALPRVDVPMGRPLRDGDWIEVRWTITDPSDAAVDHPAQRRRMRLVRLAEQAEQQGGAPRLEDLAAALDVSEATVRRDLGALRDSGHRVATRGSR